EQALAAGKAVMCEKPVSGAVQDADAMIRARDRSGLPLAIAYNHIYDPMVPWLKQRLRDGLIGRVERASLAACWPRHIDYYQRNNWAGKFQVDGQWVMDSPANNALAHFLHLALFVLGGAPGDSAVPRRIETELYRAQACENFDAIALRAPLDTGVEFLLLMTHACREQSGPVLTLQGTAGRVTWDNKGASIETARGQETVAASPAVSFDMLERFARLVRGREESSRVYGTVEMARAQTLLVNAASAAAPVVAVPRDVIIEFDQTFGEETFHYLGVQGMEECFVRCQNEWQLPHETKMFDWTRPAGKLDLAGYTEFRGPRQG
ncbi:Gfo/Idh/MocA family oxidoreductase, partial [bacterium]|nr:Gfo/Idh/MocA family oxidoreductase [bacterium]